MRDEDYTKYLNELAAQHDYADVCADEDAITFSEKSGKIISHNRRV